MSAHDDYPQISYDPATRVATIDGVQFSRDFFSQLTASPPGVRFRIISRENGTITVAQDRDPLEFAAPDMLAALEGSLSVIEAASEYSPPEMQKGFDAWREQIVAAITKAKTAHL